MSKPLGVKFRLVKLNKGFNPREGREARHVLIRRILKDGGVDGVTALQRALSKEGLDVTRKTLYKDLECMPDFSPEEMHRHDTLVLAVFRNNLRQLREMRDSSEDVKDKLAAIREIRLTLESQEKVRHLVYSRKGLEDKDSRVITPTVIRFGDDVEVELSESSTSTSSPKRMTVGVTTRESLSSKPLRE